MATLWTDIIDPATLTGYARRAVADYELAKGTLARWLPNKFVADIVVRFLKGQTGLIDVADWRPFDAEIEIGKKPGGKRVTLELPALGREFPVTEYEQLRGRGGVVGDAEALLAIQNTVKLAIRAVVDQMERQRGIVLATGNAATTQVDDFGRPSGNTVTAGTLWSTGASVDRLAYMQTLYDLYKTASGGEEPGCMVGSTRVFRSIQAGSQFQTQLINGGARPSREDEVRGLIEGAGLPPFIKYDRQVSVGGTLTKVLPDNLLMFLPAPVDPNDSAGTQLGNTVWGRTLTSTDAGWAIPAVDQPGVVAGVYQHEKPPMIKEVIADAIGMPILANGELSVAATVLS